jgi:hypothetical protein
MVDHVLHCFSRSSCEVFQVVDHKQIIYGMLICILKDGAGCVGWQHVDIVKFAAISAHEEPPLGIEPRTFSLQD